jgi:hypothetical protein
VSSRLWEFISLANERDQIRLRRSRGEPPPWTQDPVLQTTRLCNVFRDDDKTTRWLRDNVTRPLVVARDDSVFLSIIAFRWFNLIETGESILPFLNGELEWSSPSVHARLKERRDAGLPIFTGAFIVNSKPGMDKLSSILDCIDNVARVWHSTVADWRLNEYRMEEAFNDLRLFPRLGNFMAYQAVRDLINTPLVDTADIDTWTCAGPGCARGLGWVFHRDMDHWSYGSRRDQEQMIEAAREVLQASRDHWHDRSRPWTLQEVETWACEVAKIVSIREGGRAKRKFRASMSS